MSLYLEAKIRKVDRTSNKRQHGVEEGDKCEERDKHGRHVGDERYGVGRAFGRRFDQVPFIPADGKWRRTFMHVCQDFFPCL